MSAPSAATRRAKSFPKPDHTLNTLQLDGRNEVIICEADATLNDEDDGEAAYFAAMKKAFNDNAKYAAWYLQNSDIWSDFMENTTDHPNGAYAFCTVCGELQAAKKHDYVIGTLEDGKYGLNDYIVGEDGKPVVAEGVTEATMTCRNVLVCTNCLDVSKRGAHGETVAATCREGGYCKVCGEQRTAQLQHQYIDLGAVLTGKALDTDKYEGIKYNNKDVTYGQLRDAYEKVVATETWMKPVAATCTTGGLNVYVCYKCLLDAANGTEFEWATSTLKEDSTIDATETDKYSYSAYTAASTTGHDYETVYFDLKATDPATDTPKDYAQTNCEFGFKVAYKCKNCGHWYTNTLVADNTTTTDKNEAEANVKEKIKLDGATVEVGFTDAKGFILDTSSIADLTDKTLKQEDFDKLTAEDHKDSHLVYIPANYASLNNYTAPNCVEVAVLPVVCLHCGAQLEYSVDTLKGEAPKWESDNKTPCL